MNFSAAAADPASMTLNGAAAIASLQAVIGAVLGVDVPVLMGAIAGAGIAQSFEHGTPIHSAAVQWVLWSLIAVLLVGFVTYLFMVVGGSDVPTKAQSGIAAAIGLWGRAGREAVPRCARLVAYRLLRKWLPRGPQ